MAAPSGRVLLPKGDQGGLPEEGTLHHGIASWDVAGTYTFFVPHGVTRLLIDLQGGWALGGDNGIITIIYTPISGARVLHWLDVTPGSSLTIVVGGAGSNAASGGDSTVTSTTATLTAGGGIPGSYTLPPVTLTTAAAMRATSGGNVLAQGSGVGYCVIQW